MSWGFCLCFKERMIHDFRAPYFRYSSGHAVCNVPILRELGGSRRIMGVCGAKPLVIPSSS